MSFSVAVGCFIAIYITFYCFFKMDRILSFFGWKSDPVDGTPFVKEALRDDTVTVFSKSWCPYCISAKSTLNSLVPEHKLNIIELNKHPHGSSIQDALERMTGQRTVPHIWIGKEPVGGNSEIQQMHHTEKTLSEKLKKIGALKKELYDE